MIFRLRQYKVAPEKIDVFNTFFRERLLPVQKRYGACLIGRWQTENGNRVAALWVYDRGRRSTQAPSFYGGVTLTVLSNMNLFRLKFVSIPILLKHRSSDAQN